MKRMFMFTFGIHHELANRCQPIIASNMEQAEKEIFKFYGRNFSSGYPFEVFERHVKRGVFTDLIPLKTMYAQEVS